METDNGWKYDFDLYLDMEVHERRYNHNGSPYAAVLASGIMRGSKTRWRAYVWIPNNSRSSCQLSLRCSDSEYLAKHFLDSFLE